MTDDAHRASVRAMLFNAAFWVVGLALLAYAFCGAPGLA